MIQNELHPWMQPIPLPPLKSDNTPDVQNALPAKTAPAAAPPATEQPPQSPRRAQDDDYQWLILL
jgi:hypothetical protein